MSLRNSLWGVSLAAAVVVAVPGARPALAQMGHEGHGAAIVAPASAGVVVREATVQGRKFVYRLYSWQERNVLMKGMEGMEMAGMDNSGRSSHHLVLQASGADGKPLAGGKVGFVVTAPDKTEFKTLTMAMGSGYGADVPLRAVGVHAIKTKAVFGDVTLTDEFSYTVK